MALDASLTGKTYPDLSYAVTAEAIRAYAAATNETNPAYAGADPVAPPCFPMVPAGPAVAAVMFDSDLGAIVARLVHGEQEHVLHLPIRPGDTLTVASSLEAVESKESGETFTVLSRLTNQDAALAAELRSLMFIRGSRPRTRGGGGEEYRFAPELAFEVTEKVDDDQTYRYAEASGDHNPIHTDPEFARNVAGLPGIILHGMCTMSFAARAVVDGVAGGNPQALKRIKVRFSRPVFPGQELVTAGWLEDVVGHISIYGFETLLPNQSKVLTGGIAEVDGWL